MESLVVRNNPADTRKAIPRKLLTGVVFKYALHVMTQVCIYFDQLINLNYRFHCSPHGGFSRLYIAGPPSCQSNPGEPNPWSWVDLIGSEE